MPGGGEGGGGFRCPPPPPPSNLLLLLVLHSTQISISDSVISFYRDFYTLHSTQYCNIGVDGDSALWNWAIAHTLGCSASQYSTPYFVGTYFVHINQFTQDTAHQYKQSAFVSFSGPVSRSALLFHVPRTPSPATPDHAMLLRRSGATLATP